MNLVCWRHQKLLGKCLACLLGLLLDSIRALNWKGVLEGSCLLVLVVGCILVWLFVGSEAWLLDSFTVEILESLFFAVSGWRDVSEVQQFAFQLNEPVFFFKVQTVPFGVRMVSNHPLLVLGPLSQVGRHLEILVVVQQHVYCLRVQRGIVLYKVAFGIKAVIGLHFEGVQFLLKVYKHSLALKFFF